MGGQMSTRDYKSKFHFGDPELPYKHRSTVERFKREKCDNCGRFVKWYTLSFDEDMQTIVCHHCAPSVEFDECDNDVATLLVDNDPFKWR